MGAANRYYVDIYDAFDGWGIWGFWPERLSIPSTRRERVVTSSMPSLPKRTSQQASIGGSSMARWFRSRLRETTVMPALGVPVGELLS